MRMEGACSIKFALQAGVGQVSVTKEYLSVFEDSGAWVVGPNIHSAHVVFSSDQSTQRVFDHSGEKANKVLTTC